jgi:hypothetical protein
MVRKEVKMLEESSTGIIDVPITKKPVHVKWLIGYLVSFFAGVFINFNCNGGFLASCGAFMGWGGIILAGLWGFCRMIQSADPDISGKLRTSKVGPSKAAEDFIDGNPVGITPMGVTSSLKCGVYLFKDD